MGTFFKVIGGILIVVGAIAAGILWPTSAGTGIESLAARSIAHEFWIGGFLSGLFFIGFGQILDLLMAIRDRMTPAAMLQTTGELAAIVPVQDAAEARAIFATELRTNMGKHGAEVSVLAEGPGNKALRIAGVGAFSKGILLDSEKGTGRQAKLLGFRNLIVVGIDGQATELAL